MYIDSINKNNTDCSLSAFGNLLICSNAISANKTVTFPNGYELDSNLSFKILFTNGHNCIDDSTHMTLSDGSNAYPIVVNKDGTLIPLPIHAMDEGGVTVYKSLQPNTILEMYFDSTYATNTGAFVIIGNPTVLSSETDGYTIYANGKIGDNNIGDIKESMNSTAPYGWFNLCETEANRTVSKTKYADLLVWANDNGLYGSEKPFKDAIDTNYFIIPDFRESSLKGIGLTSKANNHVNTNGLSIGEFINDRNKSHNHGLTVVREGSAGTYYDYQGTNIAFPGIVGGSTVWKSYATSGSGEATNEVKSIGVNYFIKCFY